MFYLGIIVTADIQDGRVTGSFICVARLIVDRLLLSHHFNASSPLLIRVAAVYIHLLRYTLFFSFCVYHSLGASDGAWRERSAATLILITVTRSVPECIKRSARQDVTCKTCIHTCSDNLSISLFLRSYEIIEILNFFNLIYWDLHYKPDHGPFVTFVC